ncbi:MAG: HEAT repeat domain-containing protein [Deltaproteobacteria bacterium]|nr:HEAT repeat domain-containing protein [Deltaproteobacteria bacterium]
MKGSKILSQLTLLLLVGWSGACTSTEKESSAPAQRASLNKAPPPRKKVLEADLPACWSPSIRKAYLGLRGVAPKERGQAIKGLLALAKHGAKAKDALQRLAQDKSLAQRVRAMAGIMLVRLHRYDRVSLKRLLSSKNSFMAQEAGLLLKSEPLPARVEELLQALLADPSAEKKKWAATALAVDHPQSSEKALQGMLKMVVADKETRMQAAFALVMAKSKDLKKLESFAKPGNDRLLRYAAFNELMQHGSPGRAIVKRLAQEPGEKLRKHLEQLLKKP